MKPVHLPITGHDLLAVERFRDDTRHMAEFLVLTDCPLGKEGRYIRRFLTEDGYAEAQEAQRQGQIRVYKHANIIEGHIIPAKQKNGAANKKGGFRYVFAGFFNQQTVVL